MMRTCSKRRSISALAAGARTADIAEPARKTFDPGMGDGAPMRRNGRQREGARLMATHFTRRSALTIIAGSGALLSTGRASAEVKLGRAIFTVAVPIYQSQFVADRGRILQGSWTRLQADLGWQRRQDPRDHCPDRKADVVLVMLPIRCNCSNHGRAGRSPMPTDTRSSSVMFIIRRYLGIRVLRRWRS